MRRGTRGLTAAILGSLALAAPAAANNEITDPCGVDSASLAGLSSRDPTLPWLDVCGADVRGTSGSGTLRGVYARMHLAGDTANRAGAAAYSVNFTAGRCTAALRYADLGPATPGGRVSILGQCNGRSEPCPVTVPGTTCFEFVGGTEFDRTLPARAARISGSTVTFTFDPNALPTRGVPRALFDAFRPGQSLTGLLAFSYARAQYGPTEDYSAFWVTDEASSDKGVALG